MKLDHHEKIFRKTLQEHHVSLDTRTLWSQIESRIESKKEDRRPFFMWWTFGGLSVLALLTVALFLFNRNDSIPTFENEKPTATQKLITATNDIANEKIENTPLNVTALSIAADLNNNKETSLPKAVVENTKNQTTKSVSQTRLNSEPGGAKLSVQSHINSREFESTSADVKTKQTKLDEIEVHSFTDQEKSTIQSNAQSANLEDEGSIIPTYIERIETFAAEPATTRAKQAISTLDPRIMDNKIVSKINFVELQLLTLNQTSLMQHGVLKPISIAKENKQRWSIFAHAGHGNYAFKKSPTFDNSNIRPESNPIKDLRIKRQFQNLELGVDFRLSPSLSLQTGVSYSRFKSQTQFNNVYEVATTDADGISNVFFVNDTLDATIGAYSEYESVRQINESINKNLYQHYIDIPLSVAYSKNIGRRWSIGANVGALINIKQSTEGSFLDNENRLVSSDIDRISSSTVFNSTSDPQINYHAGVVIGYNISPTFQVYVKPSTKYIRNFQTVEFENHESIWANGLSFGIQVKLN